jgi:hypothetical protein
LVEEIGLKIVVSNVFFLFCNLSRGMLEGHRMGVRSPSSAISNLATTNKELVLVVMMDVCIIIHNMIVESRRVNYSVSDYINTG